MKIGIDFQSLEDCANLIWCLTDYDLEILKEGSFIFSNSNDSFIFIRNYGKDLSDSIKNCDIKIRAYHSFQEWKDMIGYDFFIQSQLVENYHIYNEDLKKFLDAGNISLSSASISFEHPNFYYEPLFNLVFFYYFYGFNYLNYYKLKSPKINLIGSYHKSGGKSWRDLIFQSLKSNVGDDLVTYENKSYNMKNLFQPHVNGFGLWGLNHITTYTDYKTSVCNLLFETLEDDANNGYPDQKMYGRRYITEKTLKAILFGEEEIFFMWYGPNDIYNYLIELGFWFYNSEFYKGDLKESITEAGKELKILKSKLGSNDMVQDHLIQNYGHKLKNNVILMKQHIDNYYKKDNVINLIKNGKRN